MPLRVIYGETETQIENEGQLCFTSSEAAARVGCSMKTLVKHIDLGHLTPLPERIGQTAFFLEKDVEAVREMRLKRGY